MKTGVPRPAAGRVTVTAIEVWKDRSVGIVEPLASLFAYDAQNLYVALRKAEKMTDVSAVLVTFEVAILVDIDALDVLFREHLAYSARGGRIVLCCVSAPIRRGLELSGLANRIQIYPGLDEALRELSPQ